MLAATLITKHGRCGSRWNLGSDTGCLLSLDGCRLLMLAVAVELSRLGRDSDLPRLDLLGLRNTERQNAVFEGRHGLVRLEAFRQVESSHEAPAADLLQQQALASWDHRTRVAGDGQGVALHRDLDLFGLDAGQDRLDDDFVVGCADVHRHHLPFPELPGPGLDEALLEELVHGLAQGEQVSEWACTPDNCHLAPPTGPRPSPGRVLTIWRPY